MEWDLDDKWVWKDGKSSSYSVNFAYAFLRDEIKGREQFHVCKVLED